MSGQLTTSKTLINRIHRLVGQLNGLEKIIDSDETDKIYIQLEAIVSASKALQASYIGLLIDKNGDMDTETRQIVERLIRQR